MAAALALRPHHPFHIFIPSPNRILHKPRLFSAISSSPTLTLTLDPDQPRHYGPSLRRGRRPHPALAPPASDPGEGSIDRGSFARTFDVAALRVPAEECFALEARLRGHLLNWPRVRNVARVPGDDVDPNLKRFMRDASGDSGQRLSSLARRANGESQDNGENEAEAVAVAGDLIPVMYREKLAKDFNWRGFVRFRNLAKISRPKRKTKSREGERECSQVKESTRKSDFVIIEVVTDGEEEEDLRGLLGDDFQWGRWRGPTRLLLLDERYANKGPEELPEAVKVAVMLCRVTR